MIRSLMYERLVKPVLASALLMGVTVSPLANAGTITISTENTAGEPVSGFRYLVEKDPMYTATPGADVSKYPEEIAKSVSFNFHKSHSPVALDSDGKGMSGETASSTFDVTKVPEGAYFVSVLPFKGHSLGGGRVVVGPDGTTSADASVSVRVVDGPIPTSQISIQIFEDNSPINGAIDQTERGINGSYIDSDGVKKFVPFHVTLEDPAGQYGAGGGRVAYDAYGNPLGTEYNPDGSVSSYPKDTNGVIVSPGSHPENAGVLVPNDQGYLVIKNLRPGKYGVIVTPPEGAGWHQTTSIEGTVVNDAWVKANNPEVFVEFGPPGPHVFFGFVRDFDCLTNAPYPGETGLDSGDSAGAKDQDLNPCYGYAGNKLDAEEVATTATVIGSTVDNHMSRSPDFQFHNGTPFPGCRVGVNLGTSGQTIYSGPCDGDSNFKISGLQQGDYSLSVFDDGLDAVIANHPFRIAGSNGSFTVNALTVAAAGSNPNGNTTTVDPVCTANVCDLKELPLFNWFFKLHTSEFFDRDQDGYRDCVTAECNDVARDDVRVNADSFTNNIRWRDGRIYQSVAVDVEGSAPFDQVFPFFHWLVAESDFTKFKPTGATFTVDAGGSDANLQTNGYVAQDQVGLADCTDETTNGKDGLIYSIPGDGLTDPSITECSHDGGKTRTEKGQVLTEAFQGFLGQKSIMEFGRANYGKNENGGISGMAIYAITRAENDPRYAAAEIWEPGIPRVQFALYQADDQDNRAIKDFNGSGSIETPDVDNYPLCWKGWDADFVAAHTDLCPNGAVPGPEDTDNDQAGVFDFGDAIDVTWSDSWDDSLPENCQGANQMSVIADNACFDGMRNWNQIRPGVFDGGYAFPNDPAAGTQRKGEDGKFYLKSGYYIVQGFAPPGYEDLKEESKNVDFGDEFTVPQLLPPLCVGNEHTVPDYMTFVTDANGELYSQDLAEFTAPFAGESRPYCDRKQIVLTEGKNAAADFHFFTEVPKASHVVGGILNDVANEFNPNSPTFGEKFAPPWLPVAFYDWTGYEVTRVYTDQYGKYNAMLPSTFTANAASPSGFTPNMLTACMNDGGYVTLPDGSKGVDPHYNPQYTQFCYTFQYMPGATTYLDTPVLQLAAFPGSGKQLDCEAADLTPMIKSVTAPDFNGPYIAYRNNANDARRTLTITSVGKRDVLNPSSNEFTQKFVTRDYGFGNPASEDEWGTVTLLKENGDIYNATVSSWNDDEITAVVPRHIKAGRYQLTVTTNDGAETPMGVTVMVGGAAKVFAQVNDLDADPLASPIQDAIDAADIGDVILVGPGVYDEQVIMSKPVYLLGAGAFSTTINARSVPTDKVKIWKERIAAKVGNEIALLDGQAAGPLLFDTEEGPGVFVSGTEPGSGTNFNNGKRSSLISGFTITGAQTGGGIFMNGYVNGLDISNNRITGNEGTYSGGIRFGHPSLLAANELYTNPRNRNVRIHHNQIIRNGAQNGTGGGVAIYNGSNNYKITDNLICGNFAATDGAGIGHLGYSTGGLIEHNQIIFNQSFRQTPGFETDGGGIFIGGMDPAPGEATGLTQGIGSVAINRNLIQGNQAGAGDGGGIALRRLNGRDIARNPDGTDPRNGRKWQGQVDITNNTIVNNVAGLAGGAISMKDAVMVNIVNNTIANNNSTATAGAAFTKPVDANGNTESDPQIAGIASYHHRTLAGVLDVASGQYSANFANPLLVNNILWHNKSSIFSLNQGNPGSCQDPNGLPCSPSKLDLVEGYTDVGVVLPDEVNGSLEVLETTGSNLLSTDTDPLFVQEYLNGDGGYSPIQVEFQTVMTAVAAPALDEGGNWIDVRFWPLSINDIDLNKPDDQPSSYKLSSDTSPAVDAGELTSSRPGDLDIDGEPESGSAVDLGSDEVQQTVQAAQ